MHQDKELVPWQSRCRGLHTKQTPMSYFSFKFYSWLRSVLWILLKWGHFLKPWAWTGYFSNSTSLFVINKKFSTNGYYDLISKKLLFYAKRDVHGDFWAQMVNIIVIFQVFFIDFSDILQGLFFYIKYDNYVSRLWCFWTPPFEGA